MNWIDQAESEVLKAIEEALRTHSQARIAVCGGRSPAPLYERLNKLDLPWDKILWIQTDERYVPANHPDSNAKMIREKLLAGHPAAQFLRFDTSLPWKESAAAMNTALLTLKSEREPLLDLAILGVGEDGHVASLFEVQNSTSLALSTRTATHAVKERLSLSLKALLYSKKVMVLILGEDKKLKLMSPGAHDHTPYQHLVENLTKGQLDILYD